MAYHDTSNLRLEVEVPTDGLPNLVQNPSGAKGVYGWISPVANTYIDGGYFLGSDPVLQFVTLVSQATYFTSEFMPVAATKYVAARYDVYGYSINTVNVKVRFEWYDVNKVLLSSSVQSTASTATLGTYFVPSIQAPASTAFVKIRFDMYRSTGNPASNDYIRLNNIMVTWADTSAGIGSARTNMILNPSAETNSLYWEGDASGVSNDCVSRSTLQADAGTASIKATNFTGATVGTMRVYLLAADADAGHPSTFFTVTGGKDYTFQVRTRPNTTARSAGIRIQWTNSTGSYNGGQSSQPLVTETAGTWTTLTFTATAPSAATRAIIWVGYVGVANNETHFLDAAIFQQASSISSYFDGSTTAAGGKTYAWNGTAHASTSVETAGLTAWAFSEPNDWQNILGPTHEISIDRGALDVGTMTATVLDALLDPSVAPEIRPGKKIRLTADAAGTGVFENVYEGRLTKAHVSYERSKFDASLNVNTKIELSATDNIAVLANQPESRGVPFMPSLAYLLEGKGVPWFIDGISQQCTGGPIVSSNENASLLDQIAICRDTVLGVAYVDRYNNLIADTSHTGETWEFTDIPGGVGYTDIDVSFDTDECINTVNVTWLRFNATTGQTEEIAYGPYRDQASINTWGALASTFTIHGTSESSSAIADYAADILAANSTPVIKANSLTFNVRDADTLQTATQLELYDVAEVTFSDKLDEADYRVTSIRHTITPNGWFVTLGLGSATAVAAPVVTPSPAANYGTADGVWNPLTYSNGWVDNGGSGEPVASYMRKNGIVYLRGRIKSGTNTDDYLMFTLPVGFRPDADLRGIPAVRGETGVSLWFMTIRSNGRVEPTALNANSAVSINNISFVAGA